VLAHQRSLFCLVPFKLQRFDADQKSMASELQPMQQKPAAAIGLFECKALLANGADTICRISVTLNLTFKRVPAAGSRSEWKTGIDAIPDDADAADTRAREPDPAVSNS
jgi:hypothetical protein